MLKSDNQEKRSSMISGSGLRIFRLLLSVTVLLFSSQSMSAERPPDVSEIKTPAAVRDVVAIHPFRLEQAYRHDWRAERPSVKSGALVVLRVNPELVFPRNAAEPVLYAGLQTVQRLNHGYESGHVIGIMPEGVDLAREPVWFGSPELPERVNADTIEAERVRAEEAGIKPFDEERVRDVTGERLEARDLAELLREFGAKLVEEYSPREEALAATWRLPVAQGKAHK